jgi:hypothetical protein
MIERFALTGQKEENEAEELIEITTYIREDQALALEILEKARQYSSGVNFDKGTLIREAPDLMVEKYRTDFRPIFR